jgi:hypothetical protein
LTGHGDLSVGFGWPTMKKKWVFFFFFFFFFFSGDDDDWRWWSAGWIWPARDEEETGFVFFLYVSDLVAQKQAKFPSVCEPLPFIFFMFLLTQKQAFFFFFFFFFEVPVKISKKEFEAFQSMHART